MYAPSSILVVLEADKTEQPALSRAIDLAARINANITVIDVIYDFSYEMTTMLSSDERESMRHAVVNDRKQYISEILRPYNGASLNVVVEWHNRAYEAIIRYVIENDIALVIKASKAHDDLRSILFTPTDWHLIRKCPTPVLLVKSHQWQTNGKILTALSVGTDDVEHAQLNHKLTQIALRYAELLDATAHFVNAYPGTPLNIALEVPEFDPERYNTSVRDYHRQQMKLHTSKYDIDVSLCHICEGLPEKVVPMVAKQIDAELVVIGTVGRVGISAALIGNTAEHVLDELHCDVLAVKPDDFVCPVR
jgi:universal stress protein E